MEYSPNIAAPAQAGSPLTSSLFSDLTTMAQYAAAVPADKVILGDALVRRRLADDREHAFGHGNGSRDDAARQSDHGQRPPDLLGPGNRLGVDGVPGRHPVARGLLRRPDIALPDQLSRRPLRAARHGFVGSRHGGR